MNRVLIRVIVGSLLLVGLGLCVYADYSRSTSTAVTVLVGCFACVSFREMCVMARLRGIRPAEILGFAPVLVQFALALQIDVPKAVLLVIPGLFVPLLLLRCVVFPKTSSPVDVAVTFLACTYVLMLFSVAQPTFTMFPEEWTYWLLFLIATNCGSDVADFLVSHTFGRHLLAPTLSSTKTREGAVVGLIAGTILGYLALQGWKGGESQNGVAHGIFPDPHKVKVYVAFAGVVTVSAQLGGLVNLAFKRWAGTKDSGSLIPGLGGALDRAASFMLSAPIAWFYLMNIFPRDRFGRG